MKQTLQNEMDIKLAQYDKLNADKRAILSEYLPIKEEMETLRDEIDELENKIWSIESEESLKEDDGVKTIEENEAIELQQLQDEIINPDDYVKSDIKDLESSIV